MFCTCVIPFYNEKERIGKVLEVMNKIKSIDQIICVDDGSSDGGSDFVKKKYPFVELLQLPFNEGKSIAVQKSLPKIKNDIVLLMDADLKGLIPEEIEEQIGNFFANINNADMVVLRRRQVPWFTKLDRGGIVLSGTRIMKKKDLKLVFSNKIFGYQLETAINEYMLQNNKKIYWQYFTAFNTYAFQKVGWIKGIKKELLMFKQIFKYLGIFTFLKQVLFFSKQKLR